MPIIVLLGYPIPRRRGDIPSEVHWQAILLPEFREGGTPPAGFRPNERGWWQRDRTGVLSDHERLTYLESANWHPDRLQARGRYAKAMRHARFAIIGIGALGSILAELLVRGGVSDLLLLDYDILEAGNLVRHTLDGGDIGKNKASALRVRLSSVSPFASIRSVEGWLSPNREKLESLLDDRDAIIDCTGSDEALAVLEQGWWGTPRAFFSASVGHRAKRLFTFASYGHSFPHAEFRSAVAPYLIEEQAGRATDEEVIEGAGCWSPVFPARMDDLMLAGATCVKNIEEFMAVRRGRHEFLVFEQISSTRFDGFRRIKRESEGRVQE